MHLLYVWGKGGIGFCSLFQYREVHGCISGLIWKKNGKLLFSNLNQNLRHWILKISFIFNIFSSLNIGSVWALNFMFVIIRMARFWILKILFQSNPQQVIPNCRWESIKESYISFIAAIGRYLFSLFITPRVRDILFAIFEEWDFQFMFSFIVSPRKLNWVTLSMTEPFSVRWGISFSAITFW